VSGKIGMNQLLDTTVFVDYYRKAPRAQQFLQNETALLCSVITAAELIRGSRNKNEQRNVEKLLSKIELVPLNTQIGTIMLELMKKYYLSHGLQIPDALIAATAIEEALTLVTSNVKHFSFIKGLKLEDWSRL